MKRKAALTAIALIVVMLCVQLSFAVGDLTIVKTVPNDGEEGKPSGYSRRA